MSKTSKQLYIRLDAATTARLQRRVKQEKAKDPFATQSSVARALLMEALNAR